MNDLYQEIILEEAKHPKNKGSLAEADLVLTGGNKSCGDEVTIYLKLSADGQRITDLAWEGQGCVISQSAMSLLSEKIKNGNLKIEAVRQLELKDMLELLGLDDISPGRMKCAMLGVSTLQKKDV